MVQSKTTNYTAKREREGRNNLACVSQPLFLCFYPFISSPNRQVRFNSFSLSARSRPTRSEHALPRARIVSVCAKLLVFLQRRQVCYKRCSLVVQTTRQRRTTTDGKSIYSSKRRRLRTVLAPPAPERRAAVKCRCSHMCVYLSLTLIAYTVCAPPFPVRASLA